MSHDPNAQFDQNVLDQIEHSPVGAVPGTPAYQDALNRLRAANQVYPSADHKGGYVTVRSLARLAVFHAVNLDALVAGQINATELETNASIFDRYLGSLPPALRPRAEALRATVAGKPVHHRAKHVGDHTIVAHDPIHTLFLVPGTGPHPGLPGSYLYGSALQLSTDADSAWAIQIHDSDDGAALCDLPNLAAALAKLQEVLMSAPFNLNELAGLGFRIK